MNPPFFVAFLLLENLFARTYGGWEEDWAYSLTRAPDGGYMVAGYSWSYGAGSNDFLVLKMDEQGNLSWARTIGGNHGERCWAITISSEGGYFLAGRTYSYGAGNGDVFLVRLTDNGEFSWARTYGGTNYDWAYSVAPCRDGGCVAVGLTQSFGAGYYDAFALKVNDLGEMVWAKAFGGGAYDAAYSVIQARDGGYLFVGSTESFGSGYSDVLIIKLDEDGNLSWEIGVGGTRNEIGLSVVQTSDGGYVVAGMTESFGFGNSDFLVIKLNQQGQVLWSKTLGGANHDTAYCVVETSDGGLLVSGSTQSFGVGSGDFLIIKMDENGEIMWARTFGGEGYDRACSAVEAQDGYVVTGSAESFSVQVSDLVLLKVDKDGNYPGCVQECFPGTTAPNLGSSSFSGSSDCFPSVNSIVPVVLLPNLTTQDLCPTEIDDESGSSHPADVICYPAPGGLLFSSSGTWELRLYASDGRLIRSQRLAKGTHRIWLEIGVYFWATYPASRKPLSLVPSCRGTAIVR